ncbi:MAG: hypothetical protein KF871_12360 [Hydrogenophaga sp.]|uniref:PP0621 family protein n=1 Tax=Hydrogenophaga sp. TaxID=1904254 RepID=UPI001DCCD2A7|nr:PP0621 family protein [Hydrogenophaga sp.]MBX3610679.1 hypothetical protein [Hydrogenophaga sp.]
MKYLLVFAVVMVAYWIWRNNRREEMAARAAPKARRAVAAPVTMVACRVCGTHMPHTEAVQGREGVYCSQEHRQRIEGPPA